MGAVAGTPDNVEPSLLGCGSQAEARQRSSLPSVQWQAVAKKKCRIPRKGGAWLFNEAFQGDIEDAKRQAAAVGGAHFTKYDAWLQVVGSDSYIDVPSDPSAVLFSLASAAWTPLGSSHFNVDPGGVLQTHGEDEPVNIISNVPATAVSFRVTGGDAQRQLGLAIGTSGHANSHFTLISEPDGGILAGNALFGWDVRFCGCSSDGDVLTIEHTGCEVVFWRNDEVLHALVFSLTPGEQFYAYASISQPGGEMRELTYVPVPVKPTLSYRLYRFTPTRLRSDSATAVHISQLKFRRQGPPGFIINTRLAVASNPGGHNPASQGPQMAIDGKRETKWLDLNKGSLVVFFPASVYEQLIIDEFCFATGNDCSDRDPVQWRLEGSMTGTEWTPLHIQSHFYDTPRQRRTQTTWFPFNTFDVVQEPSASCRDIEMDTAPCLVTKAIFEAQLRGVTCMSWPEFRAAAAAPSPALDSSNKVPAPALLSFIRSVAIFGLNMLIWFLLMLLGKQHSPILGLGATLAYGFVLQAVLALEPSVTPPHRAPSQLWGKRKGLKQD